MNTDQPILEFRHSGGWGKAEPFSPSGLTPPFNLHLPKSTTNVFDANAQRAYMSWINIRH